MTVKAVATRGCPVVQTRRAETSARSTQLRRGGPALTARRKLARDAQRVESAYSLTTSRRGDRSARTVAPRAAGEVQVKRQNDALRVSKCVRVLLDCRRKED